MGRLFCFDTMRTKRTFTHESTRSLEILRLDLIPLAVASVAVSHCQQIHWALDFCRDSCEPLASHTGSSCLDMHGFATKTHKTTWLTSNSDKKGGHLWCGSLESRIDELTNFTPFRKWFRLLPQQLSVCSSLPIGASFAAGGLLVTAQFSLENIDGQVSTRPWRLQ